MNAISTLAATAAASSALPSALPIRSTPKNLQQPELNLVVDGLACKHRYANQFAPKDWLPEVYFGNMAGSIDDYLDMIKSLTTWKGLPENIRFYARQLQDYFKTEIGQLLLEGQYLSIVLLSKQTTYQQSGAAVIFDQSSSILGEKRRRSNEDDDEVSARSQQQESDYELSPPPQTPPHQESFGFDSDDEDTSILEEDETTITFVETDGTGSFVLSSENQKIFEEAGEWLETKIKRKIKDTIKGVRADRFAIPWVHDLLYERLKLLKCGLDPTTDENTYTSFWIAPDFTALQTGIDDLVSKGFMNENHFWPSALRRRRVRGVESAKGTSVDGYWYAMDGKVDVIFENTGSPDLVKTIMEANQDVSFRFDKATATKPVGPQTKSSLRMQISP
ncbi:hypothetical protein BGZ83_006440 [Gryganskiella cystojenkinii]|nr:hypothetical protein BGZ83_006440 [Gryganskiella cystojenkinii]